MSDAAAEIKERSPRPRRNRGPRRPSSGGDGRRRRSDDENNGELIPSVPVPPELMGQVAIGKICDIVRRGRGQFGFIFIGDGEGTRADTPRIYFNFKDYTETKFPPRRGYLVQFVCAEDDEKRVFASEVKLTEQGLQEATVREEEFQKRVASGEKKEPREPRERRDRRVREEDDRTVTLKVTCEGKSGVKVRSHPSHCHLPFIIG